jgi:DNA-binding FadR family transcriptional regulator
MNSSVRETNSSYALERLRALLDRIPPGQELQLPPERALAVDIGVGRRAVRRALEVLEAEGRLWRRQGKGTFAGASPAPHTGFVNALTARTSLLEVMEVRLEIEPGLARLAALRGTAEQIDRLAHLAARTASAEDADGRELWDSALHRKIAEAAGNQLFIALIDVIDRIRQDAQWRHLRERARSVQRTKLYIAQHDEIVAAIRERHPAEAEAAMRRHLLTLRDGLLQVLPGEIERAS